MYDVVVIGAGPAGLTAGLYTARARLKTLLIEGVSVISQATVTTTIENYPGFPDGIEGPDLIRQMRKQVERLGVESANTDVKSIKFDSTWKVSFEDRTIESLSLIIATGARPKELGISGESKLRGKGVSYCATCDGAFFRDKNIVVIGGGDTAIKETLFLTRFAKNIKLIHRRDKLRAVKVLQEEILNNEKIEIIWNSTVNEIKGENKVEGVSIANVKTNEKTNIPCDGIFVFVGYIPNTDFVKGIVDLDEDGYIITDNNMKTSRENVFACGDCRKKLLRQIITACGDGATAAYSCQQYVEKIKGLAYS